MQVLDGALELVLGLVGGVVRELRLEGAHQVVGRVDDRAVELEDRRGAGGDVRRETLDFRVEADANQRVVSLPRAAQLVDEAAHATRALCFFRCTSRICTAAGVTPGTRPACPSVTGRASARRWRTSWER